MEKNITSAAYNKTVSPDGTEVDRNIVAVINGEEMYVPIDAGNSHYKAIQDWVAEGNTIADAD